MGTVEEVTLSEDIRNWVLIPLTLASILMDILTQLAQRVFASSPGNQAKGKDEIKEAQAYMRSMRLMQQGGIIPFDGFKQRKAFFLDEKTGIFKQEVQRKSSQEQMMENPNMMTDMMKKNVTGMLPQILMWNFVSYFFTGFVMGRVPFPLSQRFRGMLQRGIDLGSLDVSYISSLSYYVLMWSGLRGLRSLIFRGQETVDPTDMMAQQMQMGLGMEPGKAIQAQAQNLELVRHEWRLSKIEEMTAVMLKANLRIK